MNIFRISARPTCLLIYAGLFFYATTSFANPGEPSTIGTVIGFIENKGQLTDDKGNAIVGVFFKAAAPGLDIYLTQKGFTFIFYRIKETGEENKKVRPFFHEQFQLHEPKKEFIEWARVDMNLEEASIRKENIIAENPVEEDYFNYYLPHCAEGITDVKTFQKVTVKNIYKGIDWVIHTNLQQGFKHEFLVHPGAKSSAIRLTYTGAVKLSLIGDMNKLLIETPLGRLSEGVLACYEEGSGLAVPSSYQLNKNWFHDESNNSYSYKLNFDIADYNKEKSLVIDPPLIWATFYGGEIFDGPRHTIADKEGNVYMTGYTESTKFPTRNPGDSSWYQGVYGGGYTDAFIVKFDNNGVRLWATYYGGSETDDGYNLATDVNGDIFLTGFTDSYNLPVQDAGNGAYYRSKLVGGRDIFIARFNRKGKRKWGTYYGGTANDASYGYGGSNMCIDTEGNIYVTSSTQSTDLPVLDQGNGSYFQSANAGSTDAYILKFNNAGVLLWATYYGGNDDDAGEGITVDAKGNIYITGLTNSVNLPLQNPGNGAYYQAIYGGGTTLYGGDVFLLKFNSSGLRQWATYYGGAGDDDSYGSCITLDKEGNIFVTGSTASVNFPVLNPGGCTYFQGVFAGGTDDGFILKFNTDGVRQWATFFGGTKIDEGPYGKCITTDRCGNVYLTGYTNSSDFPLKNPGAGAHFQDTLGRKPGDISELYAADVFISKFTNTGTLIWSTFYGGNGDDWGNAVAADQFCRLFVIGEFRGGAGSQSTGYHTKDPGGQTYYQDTARGLDSGFILKFGTTKKSGTLKVSEDTSICEGQSTLLTASGAMSYNWFPAEGLSSTTGYSVVALPETTTIYTVAGTDANGCVNYASVIVKVELLPKAVYAYNKSDLTLQFTADNSNNIASYYWDFGDRSPISTEQNPTHTYQQKETYTVTLVVTNPCGSDTVMFDIIVDGTSGSGGNVGIKHYADQPAFVKVYPNPVNDKLILEFFQDAVSDTEISLYNSLGVKLTSIIHETTVAGMQNEVLDMIDLPAGVYFYTFSYLAKNIATGVVYKQSVHH